MTRLRDDWLTAPRAQKVCRVLTEAGHQAFFVGGCVRNALIGAPVADIDLATDAHPRRVMELAAAAGLKPVPTGLAHGTVTVIAGGQPFEITTFRRDIETFGRKATVAFATDIAEDAARRDFTMNALYARPDGTVVDPLGGLPDLRARRVRFVGDPAARIAEDYLRILRFFRFHAWYGDPAAGLDRDGLAACAEGRDGIARLSRERIGAEMTRLLAAPDPAPALAAMAATGVLALVLPDGGAGMGAAEDPGGIAALVRVEAAAGVGPRWQRRMAALGFTDSWPGRLRLARADARVIAATVKALAAGAQPAEAAYRFGPEAARDAALIAAARAGTPPPPGLEAAIARGAGAKLPVRAADLPLEGKALGTELARLEGLWIASDFRLGAAELLATRTR